MRRSGWRLGRLVWVVALLWLVTTMGVRAAASAVPPEQKTYLEFIFDSSSSMSERAEGSRSRMDVAKAVLNEVVQSLPDRPDLEVALRVYGAQRKGTGCTDSVLAQNFGPVASVRKRIVDTVRSLTPKGLTPIAFSLEQAAKDFPVKKGVRNIIVLITDGEESCGGQPCKVSKRLQDQGIILEPYVVGFAVTDKEAAALRCIGQYYPATDAATLRAALASIMAKAIQPTTILVEAWGGGQSVLDQVTLEVIGVDGRVVNTVRGNPGATVQPIPVEPGVYRVRGRLNIANQDVFAEIPVLRADEGTETRTRLDFGDLTGQVVLSVRGSGMDVSDRVEVRLARGGAPVPAQWRGVPLSASLPAGVYDLTVSLRERPAISRRLQLVLPPGRVTPLEVDLGDLPGSLLITVTRGGRDVTRQCQLALYREDFLELTWGVGFDVFRYEGRAGTYRLNLKYTGEAPLEKRVDGVVVRGLDETRLAVNLDEGLGSLEARVLGNGRDVTALADVYIEGPRSLSLPLEGELRRALLPPGRYSLQAIYRGTRSEVVQVEVGPGRPARATLELNIPGRISVRSLLDGAPLSPTKVDGQVYTGDQLVGTLERDEDRLALTVPPGTYRVIGTYAQGGGQVREAEAVVAADQTAEVVLSFAAAGRIRFTATLNGKPLKGAAVGLLTPDGEFVAYLQEVEDEPGAWELAAEDGLYELRVNPNVPGYEERRFSDISVQSGQTVERSLALGQGTIRFKGTINGKPLKGASVSLVTPDGEFVSYLDEVEDEPGAWELSAAEGTYQLKVLPNIPGYEERKFPGIVLRSGEPVERTLALGQGKVRLTVTLNGKPMKGAQVSLLDEEGRFVVYLREVEGEHGAWEVTVAEGTYVLRVNPNVPGSAERKFTGIVVQAGQTAQRTVAFGQGKVRFKGTLNGQPLKGAQVRLLDEDGHFVSYLKVVEPGVWEVMAGEGVYTLQVDPALAGALTKNFKELELAAGQTVEKSLAVGQGKISVRVTAGGRPLEKATVALHKDGHFVVYLKSSGVGLWTIDAAEGTYDVEVRPGVKDLPERWFRELELASGQTLPVEAAYTP